MKNRPKTHMAALVQLELAEQARDLAFSYVAGNEEAGVALLALGEIAAEALVPCLDVDREDRARRGLLALGESARPALLRATTSGSALAAHLLESLSHKPVIARSFGQALVDEASRLTLEAAVPRLLELVKDEHLRGPALAALASINTPEALRARQHVETESLRQASDDSLARLFQDPSAFRSIFRPKGRFGALLAALSPKEDDSPMRHVLKRVGLGRYGKAWFRGRGPFAIEDEHEHELVLIAPSAPEPSLGFVKAGAFHELAVEKHDPELTGEWLFVTDLGGVPMRVAARFERETRSELFLVASNGEFGAMLGLEALDPALAMGWRAYDDS
ncbi:MAG: hypothetical protein HY791_01695 [Deltaproteobacteria bacterium]|nr:hypothetical protein [Deltaproteobacteria bacterium]